MPQGDMDTERVRHYAAMMKSFAGNIDETFERIQSMVGKLNETWRDDQFDLFKQRFDHTAQRLKQFTQEARQHSDELIRDATMAEEAHRVQMPNS